MIRQLGMAAGCIAFLLTILIPVNSSAKMLAPICANGAIFYIIMDLGEDEPFPDTGAAACHGPCLRPQKAIQKETRRLNQR